MTPPPRVHRIGSSQGAILFWGLISTAFAAAASFYYWRYTQNESTAGVLRDQIEALQERAETLNSQRDKLLATMSETSREIKLRQQLVAEKEERLNRIETSLQAAQHLSDQAQERQEAEVAVLAAFRQAIEKLATATEGTDVVPRNGRPAWRVPSSLFFALNAVKLKASGHDLLDNLGKALNGKMRDFELRVEIFTDIETLPAPDLAPPATTGPALDSRDAWGLTGARAGVLAAYLRELGTIPPGNIVVLPRGDSQTIVPPGKEGHARNRRLEISVLPLSGPFLEAAAAREEGSGPASVAKSTPGDSPKGEKKKRAAEVKPPTDSVPAGERAKPSNLGATGKPLAPPPETTRPKPSTP